MVNDLLWPILIIFSVFQISVQTVGDTHSVCPQSCETGAAVKPNFLPWGFETDGPLGLVW